MKTISGLFLAMTLSLSALAEGESTLMLIQEGEKIDARALVEIEELAFSVDRNSSFCFTGNVDSVLKLMKEWSNEGHFFSGGGGGYTIEELYATKKGVVGPKINLVLRSEVTDEIENTIYILPCK